MMEPSLTEKLELNERVAAPVAVIPPQNVAVRNVAVEAPRTTTQNAADRNVAVEAPRMTQNVAVEAPRTTQNVAVEAPRTTQNVAAVKNVGVEAPRTTQNVAAVKNVAVEAQRTTTHPFNKLVCKDLRNAGVPTLSISDEAPIRTHLDQHRKPIGLYESTQDPTSCVLAHPFFTDETRQTTSFHLFPAAPFPTVECGHDESFSVCLNRAVAENTCKREFKDDADGLAKCMRTRDY